MQPSEQGMDQGKVVPFVRASLEPHELEQMFRAHRGRLTQYLRLRLGSQSEAEDAVQIAFLRLHERVGTLHADNVLSLLYVTARNIGTDIMRHRSRSANRGDTDLSGREVENLRDEDAGAERALAARQQLSLILKIIDELPEKCRASFVSYKFHGLGYAEIAENMGVTESMIRKYVLKATAHCARRFDELEGWE